MQPFINWRYKRPREKKLNEFKDEVRKITKRGLPWPLERIINELNEQIQGWGIYFGHGNVKKLFQRLDGWIRMRIRSFIEGKKAVKHQNKRIPTSVFQKKGLKSLLTTLS